MMIKYENLNQILRRITVLIAIGAMMISAFLNAFPIEPFDVGALGLEQERMEKESNDSQYNDARDRLDQGTGSENDQRVVNDYVNENFVNNNYESGRINNSQDS